MSDTETLDDLFDRAWDRRPNEDPESLQECWDHDEATNAFWRARDEYLAKTIDAEHERIAQAIEAIVHEPDTHLTESQMIQIVRAASIARNQIERLRAPERRN